MNSKVVKSKDGCVIYADAVGNPGNPSVIMIHGFSLCAAVFDDIFNNPNYSKDVYLVRYDMRGHGRSGKPSTIEGYSSELYAADYQTVADAFHIKNSTIVGWSMGGIIPAKPYVIIIESPTATIAVDVAQYLPEGSMSGLVYLGGLPSIGPHHEEGWKSGHLESPSTAKQQQRHEGIFERSSHFWGTSIHFSR